MKPRGEGSRNPSDLRWDFHIDLDAGNIRPQSSPPRCPGAHIWEDITYMMVT